MLGFSFTGGGSSSVRMPPSSAADPRKLTASTRIAYGAVMARPAPRPCQARRSGPRCATPRAGSFPPRAGPSGRAKGDTTGTRRRRRPCRCRRGTRRRRAATSSARRGDKRPVWRRGRGRDKVRDDEDRPSAEAIDPDAGRQREQEEREEFDRAENGTSNALASTRGPQRRAARGPTPETDLANGLAGRELEEVAVSPQPSPRPKISLRAMEAIRVTVARGGTVEARHHVHGAAVRDARLVEVAGSPDLVCFFAPVRSPSRRSRWSASRPDLVDAEIAIACASHRAEPAQIAAVRGLLAKARRRKTTSNVESRKAGRRAPSTTTARASTQAFSPCVAHAAGRRPGTAAPTTRCNARS